MHTLLQQQVTGAYGGLISLRMSPRQAESSRSALSATCSSLVRDRPAPKDPAQAHQGKSARALDFDKTEGLKAMLLDKVLTNNPQLTGTGIKIGEHRRAQLC